MNKILLNLLGVTGCLALIVLIYVGIKLIDIENKRVRNEAMYQCATSSKYEVVDGDAIVSFPVKEVYEKCLAEKGIK
jgi:hypothetical protein